MSAWTTIYDDGAHHFDHAGCPAPRLDPCLNCGKNHGSHYGWACSKNNAWSEHDSLDVNQRFLTEGMASSIGLVRTVLGCVGILKPTSTSKSKSKMEKDDLAFFSTPPDGCCPCGIPLGSGRCNYH